MTTKHTPGPWMTDGAGRQEHGAIGVFSADGVACVALVQPGCLPEVGRIDAARANARLIAAAPALLAALIEARDWSDERAATRRKWTQRDQRVYEGMDAAIRAAEGGDT